MTIPTPEEYAKQSNIPMATDFDQAVTELWKLEKPSQEAQAIRSALSTSFDDPRFIQWLGDYLPDYVWDLIDIAAQRGISAGKKTCIKIAEDCAAEFEAHAGKAVNSMDRTLNKMGASDCRRVAQRIRERLNHD